MGGVRVHDLNANCLPLDPNSLYHNLLWRTYFADTYMPAERAGKIASFLPAFQLPQPLNDLFVWQEAVSEAIRVHRVAPFAALFDHAKHFGCQHESENLLTIGPFQPCHTGNLLAVEENKTEKIIP